ncbi:threonylcarbamoyl-AMP synthase [Candidatus Daviesbacteria bacterium]|nr:threonylcarbamoyl-AMP synthase [Candidatus Daviesbacteria bacterium]
MDENLVSLLKSGGIAVIPTDTIYGIVGSALIPGTVEKIYRLRKRATNKPMIILISNLNDLNHFNIKLTDTQKEFLQKIWPNPVSMILPVNGDKFQHLHRDTKSLAFRIPKDKNLLELLKETGPLVAPSANFAGGKPSETIDEAKKYFNDKVDFYIDGGQIIAKPSTLIQFTDKSVKILRAGNNNFVSKIKQECSKLGFEFDP